ncbi:hypothetical protein BJY04DRAFT_32182 [Aspergillus karnatakaensis]|uniref:uncharacterized protein n=1 Tax=Aspergillus karnatakaensis TaxID=1810916 RepID=UPI003CCE0123
MSDADDGASINHIHDASSKMFASAQTEDMTDAAVIDRALINLGHSPWGRHSWASTWRGLMALINECCLNSYCSCRPPSRGYFCMRSVVKIGMNPARTRLAISLIVSPLEYYLHFYDCNSNFRRLSGYSAGLTSTGKILHVKVLSANSKSPTGPTLSLPNVHSTPPTP